MTSISFLKHIVIHIPGIWHIYITIWHNLCDVYWSYVRYICIIAVTRRLMLRRRTLSHSSRSASTGNHYIACSYRDFYTLDCTAFASSRSWFTHHDVPVRVGPAAGECCNHRASQAEQTSWYRVTVVMRPPWDIALAKSSMPAEQMARNIHWVRMPNLKFDRYTWNIQVLI